MQVVTQKVGLVAYMLLNGAKLIRKDGVRGQKGRAFVVETDKSEQEWRIGYANTKEQQHNAKVIELLDM